MMKRVVITSLLLLALIQNVRCNDEDDNTTYVLCPGRCTFEYDHYTFRYTQARCDQFPDELILDPHVQFIDVSFNKITSLPHMNYPELRSLDLSNNAITDITEGTFDLCTNLEYLNLSMNVLTSINNVMFGVHLHNLMELDLSHNRIVTIDDFSFQFLPALKSLNISYNNLESIDGTVFFSSKLEILHMESNALSKVGSAYFQDLTELRYLSLRKNRIRSIEEDSFMLLDALQRLDLGDNELEDIRSDAFHTGIRRPFSKLQAIHLDNNKLQTIHDYAFSPFPELMYIILDYNLLKEISSVQPFPTSLTEISLRGNAALEEIRNGTFTSLKQLRSVNISGCYKLTTIDAGAFDQEESSVAAFDVSHCSLYHLSPRLLNWPKISVLHVADNRWDCDCNMNWTKITLSEEVLKTMQCSSPHQLKGQCLFDVDVKSLSCDFYTRYRYSISVALIMVATVVFISGLVLLACRFRNNLYVKPSRDSYKTVYHRAPEEEDYTDPAVSIQIDEANPETKLLKNAEPAQV